MLRKTLQLIKENLLILMFYTFYLGINILVMLTLYPKSFGMDAYTRNGRFNYFLYMTTMRNILVSLLIIFALSLFYISGFNNLIREAIFSGKTRASSFLEGIRTYLGRVVLFMLLMVAIVTVISVFMGIISIPFTIMAASSGSFSSYGITRVIMVVTMILMILPTPFISLWLPSLFLEDTGVIQSLKLGAKAGVKNYGRLLLATLLLIAPQMVYSVLNISRMQNGPLYTPGYLILFGVTAVMGLIYNIYAFVIYHEYRIKPITIRQPQGNRINP